MPFANEHRARQSSPDQFKDFRRTKPEGFPSGVEAIIGIKEDGGSEIQSVSFDASQWSPSEAKKWLADHDFSTTVEEATGEKEDAITVRLDELGPDGANIRSVRRWDLLPLESPVKTRAGFVRAQGMITRTGVFTYTRLDGSTVRELRTPEEVFRPDSMRTFELAPLTLGHPPDNLSPDTVDEFQVGAIGSPVRVGSHVRADLLITRKDAIAAVLGGKNKLSCGYDCKTVDRGGTFVNSRGDEFPFDAIQYGIIGNHVAICDNPRAGPSAQIRIDEADAFADLSTEPKGDSKVEFEDVIINGKTHRVPKDVAAAMRADGTLSLVPKVEPKPEPKADDANARALKETQDARDKAQGELAALKAKTADDDKKRADDAKRTDQKEATKKRVSLCAVAVPLLDKKLDELLELDDAEIMKAVIAKEASEVNLEGKSDAFIEGVYQTIAATKVDTKKAITTLINQGKKTGANDKGGDDAQKRADDSRQRMIDRSNNAWKPEYVRKLEAETKA